MRQSTCPALVSPTSTDQNLFLFFILRGGGGGGGGGGGTLFNSLLLADTIITHGILFYLNLKGNCHCYLSVVCIGGGGVGG